VSLQYPGAVHRVAFVLALTACYRPGADLPCTVQCGAAGACPDDLLCNAATNQCALADGTCVAGDAGFGDAADAAMIDGPPGAALCTLPVNFTRSTVGVGIWFTPDRDRIPQLAVKYEAGDIHVTEGDVHGVSYTPMLAAAMNTSYHNPRLVPGADEVFFIHNVSGVYSLRRAKRLAAGDWPTTVVLLKTEGGAITIPIAGNEEIGAPTATVPRRMLVSTGTVLDEFEEQAPDLWWRVRRHAASFAPVVFLGRATLSKDGRRLVFRGHDPATYVSGYYADRATIADSFPTTALLIPGQATDSVETPFLSDDCRDYYYTHPTSVQIQHVTFLPP